VIFVTVGMQTPFDRLVRAVDSWAASRSRDDVFAQIGATKWRPRHLRHAQFIPPREFAEHARNARLIVAHAGIGAMFTAMEMDKPILVMPRLVSLRETRNAHQFATVKYLTCRGITVAMDESELIHHLDHSDLLATSQMLGPHASAQLLNTVRKFVASSETCANRNPSGPLGSPTPTTGSSARLGDCQ